MLPMKGKKHDLECERCLTPGGGPVKVSEGYKQKFISGDLGEGME